jgi:hypothetical protein
VETFTYVVQAELSTGVWTDISADVLQEPAPRFAYGIFGAGPIDLVAGTGQFTFQLNNSQSNAGGKLGYYTPGHTNCLAGWDEGVQVRTKLSYGGTDYYKWVGRVARPAVAPGLLDDRRVEVSALDWMEQADVALISQLAIQSSKRVDQLLATAVAGMQIAPRATSYATGIETLTTAFNTDFDERVSPRVLFQKMMENELGGFLYLKGDTTGGETLRFDSRHTRPLNRTSAFTLSGTMRDLSVDYSKSNVYNVVKVKIQPLEVDAAATTELYLLQQKPYIVSGQSIELELSYRDPATGKRISASDIVTPLVANTHFKFGSTSGSANDLNSFLTITTSIGGNSAKVTLTNTAGVTGYVNLLKLIGKGIYSYDPVTLRSENTTSSAARGECVLTLNLEQHDSPLKGQSYADALKNIYSTPHPNIVVRFLANQSAALLTGALAAEPSTRFTLTDYMTGVDGDYFINGLEYTLEAGKWLWCTLTAVPADVTQWWIWNTSHWTLDGYWAL